MSLADRVAVGKESRLGRPAVIRPVNPTRSLIVNVTVKTLEPMHVACVRHTGPYNECDPAWRTLFDQANRQGWTGPATRWLGICHDDPDTTPPENIRYDACISVGPEAVPTDEVELKELAGGQYATFIHRGPFEKIAESYREFYEKWLPHSGRQQAAAPHIEFYLNNPDTTPAEELETEVCVPLK